MVEYSLGYDNDYNRNCVTGDNDHLYDRLKESISKARKIDIIVAFLMESGVRLLEEDFKEAVNRGVPLRILCGNYLNITQPQALYLLKDSLGDKVDLRFYNVPNKSFHPKAYIFEQDVGNEIFLGSSNLSRSALKHGIEWNYRLCAKTNAEDYAHFKKTFEELFLNHSNVIDDNEMRRYSKNWRRPKLFEDLERLESNAEAKGELELVNAAQLPDVFISGNEETDQGKIIAYPLPIGPQIEALYELKKSRFEGWDKGIVVAATGVGKTFLAAFDSKGFKRVLFVAHRGEILIQAERTFKCVRPELTTGYFTGEQKDKHCDVFFATVQTIGRKEYLIDKYFTRDEFDYIVIDEFHHAVSDSYMNIIEYFKPKFLLGLTATPERLDNQDVFALCDYNLVYEVRLKEAINKGWLVPFRYYGVHDVTDYDQISFKNGKYDEKQLEQVLSIEERADLVLQHYQKYNSSRSLGFCSSRKHAIFMARYFVDHGIKACAVISGNLNSNDDNSEDIQNSQFLMERKEAISKLIKAKINVVFSVDMFNEGLDVPAVDLVMFLRPTESPTVFLQQLGRGLRNTGDKKYLNVLDFIGNYNKAINIPFYLTGDVQGLGNQSRTYRIPVENEFPEGCIINFDFRLIDLFKRLSEAQKEVFDRVKDEYFRIKEANIDKPLRLSVYTYMSESIYSLIRTNKDLNIFRDYLSFLGKLDELSSDEKKLIGTIAHDFLKKIENTAMAKMYKMPILLAFYNNGRIKFTIDDEDIYQSFKAFYSHATNAVDMLKDISTQKYKEWGKTEYVKLARQNPIHFLGKSAPEFFYEDNNNNFCLSRELEKYIDNPEFIRHFKDVINYKTRKFYKERLEKRTLLHNTESEPNHENNHLQQTST